MTVAGVLLAAGEGRRFAASVSEDSDPQHKLLVEFRGRPLAAWALEAILETEFEQAYVIVGSVDLGPAINWLTINRPRVPTTDLTVVYNEDWHTGQATSVGSALDRVNADGHDAVVVGLADQPLVPASAWRSVAEASATIAVASFNGVRRPPVRLGRQVWDEVPRTGDAGARSVLRAHPELVSEIPCVGNPVDIDTAKDLRAWS